MLTFEEYCKSKKINPELFLASEKDKYAYLKNYFEQVHPDSFTSQKLFLINELRRTYLYTELKIEEKIIESTPTVAIEKSTHNAIAKPKIGVPKIPKPNMDSSSELKPILKPTIAVNTSSTEETEKEVKPALARPKIPAMKPKIPRKPIENSNPEETSETIEKKTALPKPKIPSLKPKLNEFSEEKPATSPKVAALRPKIPPKKD